MADSIEKSAEKAQIRYIDMRLDKQMILDERHRRALRERNLMAIAFTLTMIALAGIMSALFHRYKRLRNEYSNLYASVSLDESERIQELESSLIAVVPDTLEGKKAKEDIRRLVMDMTGMISEINNIYYKYKSHISSMHFQSCFDEIIKKYFPEKQTYVKIWNLCDVLYPGIMARIEKENPGLIILNHENTTIYNCCNSVLYSTYIEFEC